MKYIVSEDVFDKALRLAMRMPGVVVDRNQYLYSQLSKLSSISEVHLVVKDPNRFIEIDLELRLNLAKGSIKRHLYSVSGIAFGLGVPGLLALPFTIPADLAQFYYHTLVLMQKLLYLMGWPDLKIKDNSIDDETLAYIKLFLGAMHGLHAARSIVKVVADQMSKEIVKRLPKIPLTKYLVYNLTKAIAKWLGVKITKPIFAKLVSRMIPVVGGVVSASVTYAAFNSMANSFLVYLSSLGIARLQTGILLNENGIVESEGAIESTDFDGAEKILEKDISDLDYELTD